MRRAFALVLVALACLTAVPLAAAACEGVRPGAFVDAAEGDCTLNFLFRSETGRRYVGTAGHCVADHGSHEWHRGAGPAAKDGDGQRIGRAVWAINESERDFALIRLGRDTASSPRVCAFGGPTGLDRELRAAPVLLSFYGQGMLAGSLAPARTALALGTPDPDHIHAQGLAVFGDSGAPVTGPRGRAMGVIVTVGLHTGVIGSGVDWGLVGITRIGPEVDRAEAALGRDLRLVTAPAG